MDFFNEINLRLKASKYPYKAIVFDISGEDLDYYLKYNDKEKEWLLLDSKSQTYDISYLDIKSADFRIIKGVKTLFLRKIDNGKFNKVIFDYEKCVFTGLDINTKVWLANKIQENNAEIKKHWWENPTIVVGGFMVICLIICVWFIGNYKEGGILVDLLTNLLSIVTNIWNGLQKAGIIEKLQPGA